MDRRTLLAAGLGGALLPRVALAQPPHETGYLPGDSQEFIALWPGTPPGGAGIHLDLKVTDAVQPDGFHVRAISQIQQPGFFVSRPVKPTGLAMLIIPGGGYAAEGGDRGGREIAQYFASRGIISFVLRYRLPGEGWKLL
jgi:acetyl esterase/lipase